MKTTLSVTPDSNLNSFRGSLGSFRLTISYLYSLHSFGPNIHSILPKIAHWNKTSPPISPITTHQTPKVSIEDAADMVPLEPIRLTIPYLHSFPSFTQQIHSISAKFEQ